MADPFGRVGNPNTSVAPTRANATAADFGASIGQALKNTGGALNDLGASHDAVLDAETLAGKAFKSRSDKVRRADIDTRLVAFNAQTERDLAEARQNAPLGAENFEAQTAADVRSRYNDFTATIPADLRDEYSAKLERSVQSAQTSAFNFELDAQTNQYGLNVSELRQSATDSILSGRSRQAEWSAQFEELLANSPLPAAGTEALRLETEKVLQTAQLSRDMYVEALTPDTAVGTVPNATADGSDVVAAGLPSVARGLLNAIAGTEAPHYNTLHGGGSFEDFSDHPNAPQPTADGKQSSAAGRYQFVYKTWKRAQAALGLEDFSPENQDRAAWWLAQEDYKSRTGRSLQVDLNSSDYSLVSGARQSLSLTWEGLISGTSDDAFFKAVTGAAGTGSSLLHSDAYSAVPFSQRQQLWAQSSRNAAAEQTQQRALFDAETATMQDQLQRSIAAGSAGIGDIAAFGRERSLPFDDLQSLVGEWEDANESLASSSRIAAGLASENYRFDGSTEAKEDANNFFTQTMQAPIAGQTEGFAEAVALPVTEKLGYIPSDMTEQLARMSLSTNVQEQSYGLDMMSKLQQQNPALFAAAFGDQAESDTLFFQQASQYLTAEEVATELNGAHNPALAGVRRDRAEVLKKLRTDKPKLFEFDRVATELGYDESRSDVLTSDTLMAEYNQIFDIEFGRYGDAKQARKATLERINSSWGTTEIGGRSSLMKHPPEKSGYQPYNGSYNYIDEQVRSDFTFDDGVEFQLVPDRITSANVNEQIRPSYMVVRMQNGVWQPMLEEAPQDARELEDGTPARLTGFPARFAAEITPEMDSARLNQSVWENQSFRLNATKRELDAEIEVLEGQLQLRELGVAVDPGRVADPNSAASKAAIETRLGQLQAQRTELTPEIAATAAAEPEFDPKDVPPEERIRRELLDLARSLLANEIPIEQYTERSLALRAQLKETK